MASSQEKLETQQKDQGFGVCSKHGSVRRKMTAVNLRKRLLHPRHAAVTSGCRTDARAEVFMYNATGEVIPVQE